MKKPLKMVPILFILMLIFTGCSSETKSKQTGAGSKQPAKTIKLLTNGNNNNGDFRALKAIYEQYRKEVNPNFKMEIESIPNQSQYFQKLQTYIASNQMPDLFKLPNGPLAETLVKQGKLVDMKKTLTDFGKLDQFNKSVIDFLSFEDGSLYLYPEGTFGEAFWYWKKPFEENHIAIPKTYDEFIAACEKLKQAGYTPIAVAGKERWQLIRYLSFIPLRLTHTDFINQLKTGDEKLSGDLGMQAVNFLYTLGKKGFFQKGFSNMDYTQGLNYFLGGKAVIHYNGSWELDKLKTEYEKGNIGYFFDPDVAGGKNIGPHTSITSGLAYALNKQKFDKTTKDFFKYVVDHWGQYIYEKGGEMSPMKGDIPEEAPKLMKDFSSDLAKVTQGGVSWDDKLDPATTEAMGTAANELALGMITPKAFAKRMDEAIKENAPKFFGK